MMIQPDIFPGLDASTADLLRRHSIDADASVRTALAALNSLSGRAMTLFAVSADGLLEGTVTDGDIRRGLIAGVNLEDKVSRVMHTDFLSASPTDDLCMKIAEGRRRRLALLPVTANGRIISIIDLNSVKTMLPIDAVLMAGGRGERLRPLTLDTPKPLLKVGDKPIIEYNVEELETCGVKNIYVTVNYLAEQIIAHFNRREGRASVRCVKEPKRLGTIGSLSLIDDFENDNILLMNSDLLTSLDFEALYVRHISSGADVTMSAVPYAVSVPFAIMNIEGDWVRGIEEKPTFNYLANAGVYLIRRDLISHIPKGEYLDAPDFIASVINEGGKVGYCPVQGSWIDIGSPDDFRHANDMMNHKALFTK